MGIDKLCGLFFPFLIFFPFFLIPCNVQYAMNYRIDCMCAHAYTLTYLQQYMRHPRGRQISHTNPLPVLVLVTALQRKKVKVNVQLWSLSVNIDSYIYFQNVNLSGKGKRNLGRICPSLTSSSQWGWTSGSVRSASQYFALVQ